ncbi:uncharacterized protein LOC114075259 [Solanum pennellii]|uniref:Uncharacterized protein LOC114075259 n=1 Tax=Solanum pennellii TaxID=28526 RepID=A0ABM1V1E4_SOLPN|nr:uncharacterized protein LOC114075259 [Solanum pennellii]
MEEELSALKENHTRDLISKPAKASVIGSKWINHMATIRVLLTIASIKWWKLHQIDVKSALLHGEIHEIICMKPPLGYNQSQPDTVNIFFGLEVEYLQDGIMLSQRKYGDDLVTQACLSDQKVAYTPLEINVKYKNDDDDPLAEPTLYRRLIGCLIYLTIIRPDISYLVQVLSQFVTNPCQHHFSALLRIIRYVWSTINRVFFFHSASSLNLEGYVDADWEECPNS